LTFVSCGIVYSFHRVRISANLAAHTVFQAKLGG
jgi:hypothetical protein